MVKESILFVVSTGLLIYFVTPSDEPAKADAAPEETQKPVRQATQTSDDGWGYDDEEEEEDDESFVFGEPMTASDDVESEESRDEEESSDRQKQSNNTVSKPTSYASSNKPASPNSPEAGEKGSLDNPIVFKTNNPANPVDD